MSLATYASEFNNEGMENNPIQKKRDNIRNNIRNKTLKRRDNTQAKPVSNVEALMKKIHNNGGDYHDDDDDDESSNNFQPIQHPNSVGIERMENNNEQYNNDTVNNAMMYGDDSVNVKVDDSHQNEIIWDKKDLRNYQVNMLNNIISNMFPILIKVLMTYHLMGLIRTNC